MSHGKATQIPQVLTNCQVVAEVLNLTRRRISQLVAEQVLPAPADHRYDLVKCAARYIKYQRRTTEQQGGDGTTAELKKARAELLKMQQKNAELAYQQKTGALIPLEDLQEVVNAGTAVFTGQRRSMGSRLAGKLAGMSDPTAILKLLNAENDRILNAVADQLSSLAEQGTP